MSDNVDGFAETLRLRLTRVETLLQGLKTELQESAGAQGAALQSKLEAARATARDAARDIRTAQSKAKSWVEARESAGAAVIQGWKDGHEDRKLAQHAERAGGDLGRRPAPSRARIPSSRAVALSPH